MNTQGLDDLEAELKGLERAIMQSKDVVQNIDDAAENLAEAADVIAQTQTKLIHAIDKWAKATSHPECGACQTLYGLISEKGEGTL